jgi:hypothetical protein
MCLLPHPNPLPCGERGFFVPFLGKNHVLARMIPYVPKKREDVGIQLGE